MQYLQSILSALGIICNLGLGLYVFFSNKKAAKDEELKNTNNRITKLESKIENMPDDDDFQESRTTIKLLEERISKKPDHEDINAVRLDIRGLQSDLKGVTSTVNSVDRTVKTINDFLLNNK